MKTTTLEQTFIDKLKEAKIKPATKRRKGYTREVRFDEVRRWRFDFAWEHLKIAVELQGGTFSRRKGGHTTGIGFRQDREKMNAAILQGWKVLEFDTTHVRGSYAIRTLQELLKQHA